MICYKKAEYVVLRRSTGRTTNKIKYDRILTQAKANNLLRLWMAILYFLSDKATTHHIHLSPSICPKCVVGKGRKEGREIYRLGGSTRPHSLHCLRCRLSLRLLMRNLAPPCSAWPCSRSPCPASDSNSSSKAGGLKTPEVGPQAGRTI